MRNSINVQIPPESSDKILEEIKGRNWWQGSLIPGNDINNAIPNNHSNIAWWVIASQTCNLYNPDFEKVPVFEIIAASQIEQCAKNMVKGDNPRTLHVSAQAETEIIALELNIQKRVWLSRDLLSRLPAPNYHVFDTKKEYDNQWMKKQWLDNFIGWLARSYNRVALPDSFNDAVSNSRLKEILEKKLIKHAESLQGIYLSIDSDSDIPWDGVLGQMPPPYILNIVLIVFEDIDPEPIKNQFLTQVFDDKIKDPNCSSNKITRSELARRNGIRLIQEDIEARSVSDITLLELKNLIRYSLVDHLSDSSITPI